MRNLFLNQFADMNKVSIKKAKEMICSQFVAKTKQVYKTFGFVFTEDDEKEYRKLLQNGGCQSVFDTGTWDECGFYLCID